MLVENNNYYHNRFVDGIVLEMMHLYMFEEIYL